MKFQRHKSEELCELFCWQPYQGQHPEKASIIFLSSDANYSPKISKHPFFKYIIEYQKDGIAFWDKYGCHHPFVLKNYPTKAEGFDRRQDGVPFHRNFSKLSLQAKHHAMHICFIELLDVPTIGNKSEDPSLFFDLLCEDHLKYTDQQICGNGKKLFFVSKGVLDDIIAIKTIYPNLFSWCTVAPQRSRFSKCIQENKIKEIYHFSSSKIHDQIDDIKQDINEWLKIN